MSTSVPRTTKKIKNYQIGEQIGKGAIGVVFKGINIDNASIVAIKQISLQNLKEEDKKSIEMEINLLKKLKHENIVKYIDVLDTETHLNIILEYVDAGSLSSIIKKFGSFPESLVAIYIKQVLIGLDYLHSQGVVHRDIKGANILSTKEGLVKLADFGVATKLSEAEKSFTIVGTPYWMAPEIIEMRGHVSTSCDIWSVGCTVIELLTGNPPYIELKPMNALMRIVQDDHPQLPNGISEHCKDFLLKCFVKDPVGRLDAKDLLKHSWVKSETNDMLNIINTPHNQLPEEVTNTIRLHMDQTGILPLPLPRHFDEEDNYSSNEGDGRPTNDRRSVKYPLNQLSNNSSNLHYENMMGGASGGYNEGMMMQGRETDSRLNTMQGGRNLLNPSQSMRASGKDPSFFYGQENSQTMMNFTQTTNQDRKYLGPNSNFGALYEEGSFVSVDQDDLNARFRGAHTQNQDGSPEEYRILNELDRIIDYMISIEDYTDPANIHYLLDDINRVIYILRQFPKAKSILMNQYGLTGLIEILERTDEPEVIHVTLQLINQIIEKDKKLQEQSCIFGILPYMVKYTQAEYPRNVRVEAAYYLGQLASSGLTKIFVASGGFKALVELLDLNYEQNKDLICLAIDSLIFIIDKKILPTQHLCRILFKLGIFQRLILLIGDLYTDKDENVHQHLVKALNLMINFAKCEDSNIRQLMCEDGILLVLQTYLKKFVPSRLILSKVVRIIRYISNEPSVLNKLEIIGKIILNLIHKAVANESAINENEELLIDLANILFHMCKLNGKRQEQIALNGGIPLLLQLTKRTTKNIERITFPLLCQLVQTSDLTREKLWESGGLKIFLDYLGDDYYQQKILDAIAFWLSLEQTRIENLLMEYNVFHDLIAVFKNANKTTFQQIVPIYLKIIQLSDKLAVKFANTPEFLKEIAERLGVDPIEVDNAASKGPSGKGKISTNVPKKPVRVECSNPFAFVRKELLDIVLHLCLRHPNPRKLLNEHNLHLIIMQISHNDDMVILEGKAAQLWQIYSGQQM